MKPRIGITPSPTEDQLAHGTFTRYAMAAPYVEAVLAAGGIPIVLPPQDDHAAELLEMVDALLLSGGGDVDPARFGDDETHPETYGVHALRDRFELGLVAVALERDLPLLAICRGTQVLNVALGGTLIQHLPDQHHGPVAIIHRQHERGLASDDIGHDVDVEAGSLLARATDGAPTLGVNSYHHQAIRELAPGLVATAHAADGVVEAVEVPAATFALGVQWHPELMFARHAAQLAPFAALVAAATVRRLVARA